MEDYCEECGDGIDEDRKLVRAFTFRQNGSEASAGPIYTYCIVCAPDAIAELERDDAVDELILAYNSTDLNAIVGR